jgi:putative ABC transport system permease protein
MRLFREWMQRLWGTLRPGRRDGDLEQELRLHFEMAAEDARHGSLDPADRARAVRVAGLEAGGVSQAMDALRDQRGVPWLEDLVRDMRHGLRTLRRSPGFAAVALVTLALGIGANTAIFSIVHAVILRPLVYPQPEQLVRLVARFPSAGSTAVGLSNPEYMEFRALNRSFAHVGAFTTGRGNTGGGSGSWTGEVNLTAGDRPLRVRSAAIDDELLPALGVQPAHGRFFAAGETDAMAAQPGLGGPPLAILSHELWQTAFGGQPIVGQSVNIDGRPHEIIGIMPPGVDLMDSRPEIWLPIGMHPVVRQTRNSHVLTVVGRLKDEVTLQAAQAELDVFLENWAERTGAKGHVPTKNPPRADDHILQLQPLQEAIVGDASRAIWILQAAVGLVLLIGCANLANLAMARGESRRREFAVRTTLGASRGRLVRQMLAEGVLLSIAGGAIGLWLARVGVQALVLAYPNSLPRTSEVGLDVPVLLFALAVSIAAGLLFGLAPVLQKRAGDLVTAIKEGGDRSGTGARHHRIRQALVIGEVALAMMLVTSAGLLLRTVYNLTHVDAGFDRSRLVTFSMTLPRATMYPGGRAQVYQRLLDTLRAAPGVQAATAMTDLPLNRFVQSYAVRIESEPGAPAQTPETVDYYQFVMSDYFETMGVPIVAGRGFDRADMTSLDRVAIVNETLANKLWKGRNPVGQRVRPNLSASMGTAANPWHTVIGVAKDVKEGGVHREPGSELYLFTEQPGPPIDGTETWVVTAPPTMNVALRTSLSPAALAQTLERAVRDADPAVPIVRLREMDAVFAESIRRQRLLAQLLGAFAALALLLAAVGTYGVLSYMVTERGHEIGIRMALGSTRSSVLGLVMKQGLRATAIGIAAGLAGALAINRVMASLLFGVRPTDPATLASVVVAITVVAAAACWLPAWRASRTDPNVVLKAD